MRQVLTACNESVPDAEEIECSALDRYRCGNGGEALDFVVGQCDAVGADHVEVGEEEGRPRDVHRSQKYQRFSR